MNIQAKKSLGQNFLINEGIIDKIVAAAELQSDDALVEVGPGTGNLTKKLSGKTSRLVLIEKDHRLMESLQTSFGNQAEIVEADILTLDPNTLGLTPFFYKIVANLPYYITSHFFKTIFERWPMPECLIVMVQKEVAQRILAQPPQANLLGLSIQVHAKPELITHVSAGSFRPTPDVDSAVLKLTPYHQPLLTQPERKFFFSLTRSAFAGKRKKLSNTLEPLITQQNKNTEQALRAAGIDPFARPQHLSLTQWITLVKTLARS